MTICQVPSNPPLSMDMGDVASLSHYYVYARFDIPSSIDAANFSS